MQQDICEQRLFVVIRDDRIAECFMMSAEPVPYCVGNAFMHSGKLWQSSFYDHIIRNDEDYRIRWQYISGNPFKWVEDQFHIK